MEKPAKMKVQQGCCTTRVQNPFLKKKECLKLYSINTRSYLTCQNKGEDKPVLNKQGGTNGESMNG